MQLLVRFAVAVGAFWSMDTILFGGAHFDAACTVSRHVLAGMTQAILR